MASELSKVLTGHWVNRDIRAFIQLQGSLAGLFSDLSAGESCPLRIVPQAGPAVSPGDKPRKDSVLPPALLNFPKGTLFNMASPEKPSYPLKWSDLVITYQRSTTLCKYIKCNIIKVL